MDATDGAPPSANRCSGLSGQRALACRAAAGTEVGGWCWLSRQLAFDAAGRQPVRMGGGGETGMMYPGGGMAAASVLAHQHADTDARWRHGCNADGRQHGYDGRRVPTRTPASGCTKALCSASNPGAVSWSCSWVTIRPISTSPQPASVFSTVSSVGALTVGRTIRRMALPIRRNLRLRPIWHYAVGLEPSDPWRRYRRPNLTASGRHQGLYGPFLREPCYWSARLGRPMAAVVWRW